MKEKWWVLLILTILSGAILWGSEGDPYFDLRMQMVQEQIKNRGIIDPRILSAFMEVKRHLFVPPELRDFAYTESQIYFTESQTMARPYFVAIMTLALAPSEGKKLLDIGTGTGYLACILSRIVRTVYTIEIQEDLSLKAQQLVERLGYDNIRFKIGDGYEGWEEHAPFDGIIMTCPDDHIPQTLIDQLAVGGRMVIPVSYSQIVQELVLIRKMKDGSLRKTNILPVPDRFKPIIRNRKDEGQNTDRSQ